MSRRTASVLIYGMAAVGLGLLAFGGYKYAVTLRNVEAMSSLKRVGTAEERAFQVYRKGTLEEADRTLLQLVTMLESERARSRFEPNTHVYTFDLALNYERLAILAEKRGDLGATERYHALALSWLHAAFPNDKKTDIRQLVEKLDAAGDRGLASESAPGPPRSDASPRLPAGLRP